MNYVNAAFNILLSPLTFVLFYLITTPFNHYIFKPGAGTNTTKLIPWTYFLFCVVLFSLSFGLVAFYNITSPQPVSLIDILQPKYYWISIGCWLATALTLNTYVKGMEGNVMGFIFFPMLLVSSLALIAVNVPGLISAFNMGGQPLALNPWLAFLVHGCSPLLVLLFYANSTSSDISSPKEISIPTKFLSIYIFYGFLIGAHWVIFFFSKNSFNVAEFFGAGQSFVYFLPLLGGLLLHMYFGFSISERLGAGTLKNTVKVCLNILLTLSILLQFINYIQYIKRVW